MTEKQPKEVGFHSRFKQDAIRVHCLSGWEMPVRLAPKGQTKKVCAMNILTDHRRSRRNDLPCRSALARASAVCGTARSETTHATRSHLSDNYHIALRRRTARIHLNCRDLRHFPFVCSKTDYHITSYSVAHPYRSVPSNRKNISASVNFPRSGELWAIRISQFSCGTH